MKIYVIIIHYKGLKDTLNLLENLLNLNYQDFQIVLINNNPSEDLKENLLKFFKDKNWSNEYYVERNNRIIFGSYNLKYPIVLINQENKGYAGGVNTGLRYALEKNDFSYVWILNNDLILDSSSLIELINYAEEKKKKGIKVGIIGSKLLYYWNPRIFQGIGGRFNKYLALTSHIGGFEEDKGQYDKEIYNIDYVIGACMFVPKEFILDVGLMDEKYFLYFEDLDWSERAKRKGYKLLYCWKSKVYHKEGESIGSSSIGKEKSEIADYYWMRNRIIFTRKFYPQYLVFVYLSYLGVLINRIKRKQFKRVGLMFKAIKDSKC
ncbi:MAG: glycosyltransferase family 2 protein [Dictyoglomus sp.]|nr:glycosyltransferase family 2 protein [Dictyoglomus sp.]MDW8187998.1 glycosyltransferase family 2 protein [Dictyoglomus sp.]